MAGTFDCCPRGRLEVHSRLRAVAAIAGLRFQPSAGKRNPMPVGRYRITNPTIALFHENGRYVAHTVPTGALITIKDNAAFDGEKLMTVVWDKREVMMFTQDLRARTEPAA